MTELERVGISLEKSLLADFRSEAIRDLVRRQLSQQRAGDPDAEAVAAVFLVYDHHAAKLTERLIGLQHSHLLHVISSLHVHLDRHECLEIIVLRGKVGEIDRVGENILSMKGVKLGRVNVMAT